MSRRTEREGIPIHDHVFSVVHTSFVRRDSFIAVELKVNDISEPSVSHVNSVTVSVDASNLDGAIEAGVKETHSDTDY